LVLNRHYEILTTKMGAVTTVETRKFAILYRCHFISTKQCDMTRLPIKTYVVNWMAPWKNRISFTTMKLRKSLVKPVMQHNISSCLVLPPEIVMHDAFNVIHWMSTDICVVMHKDLWWKNLTTYYNCRFCAMSLALRVIFIRQKRPPTYASCMTISRGRTEQYVVIGGELAAVD